MLTPCGHTDSKHLLPHPQGELSLDKSKVNGPAVGTRIELPVDLARADTRSVVLGLDVRCRYCRESSDFYKRLVASVGDSDIKLLAYFSTPVQESREYLARMGIEGIDVRQVQLSDVKIHGTPTVLLVDGEGTILNSWVGKIPVDKELDVIREIVGDRQ